MCFLQFRKVYIVTLEVIQQFKKNGHGQFKWCFGLSNCHWNLCWIVALKKAWIYMFDCYYIVTFELSKETPLQRGLFLLTQWKTHHPPIILPFYILFPIHSADCWLIHFHSGYLIGSPVDEIIHILSPQCWNRCWIVTLKKGLNPYAGRFGTKGLAITFVLTDND